MAVTINTNVSALRASRQLGTTSHGLGQVFERLATGQRINKASDDAAGLSIASRLNADSRVFTQAVANINDGISLLAIADGATTALTDIVTRIRELATQASNGTVSNKQRLALDAEAQQLIDEHDRILKTTTFNGVSLFDAQNVNTSIQVGYSILNLGLGAQAYVGDGTFKPLPVQSVGSATADITLKDVNNDGNLDILGLDLSNGYLNVLLGNGDGTFKKAASYYTGSTAENVDFKDINGDGILDALVGMDTANGGSLSILLGNLDGTFGPCSVIPGTGSSSFDVLAADFNNDGNIDIYKRNILYLGNGDGTFRVSPIAVGTGPGNYSAYAADFNNDGNLDIIGGVNAGEIRIRLGNGDGTFTSSTVVNFGSNYRSISIGDFNGDGVMDFQAGDGVNVQYIFIGNGDGTFRLSSTMASGALSSSSATGDFNGDGKLDLLVFAVNDSALNIFLGNGDGTFKAYTTFATPTNNQGAVGDVNGDGILDIVKGGTGTNTVVHLGNGTTSTIALGQRYLDPQGISLRSMYDSRQAQKTLDTQLNFITAFRGVLGASQSRLLTAQNVMESTVVNYKAAESRIRDTDIADDAAQATRLQILQSVGAAVLAQANQLPALAVKLLS